MGNCATRGGKGGSGSGGKANTLLRQLVKCDTGPVGPKRSSGVQDRIPDKFHPKYLPQSGCVYLLRAEPNEQGGRENANQRGSNRTASGGSKSGFLLEPILVPKKDGVCGQ